MFSGPLVIVGGGRVDPALLAEVAGLAVGFVGADSGGDVLADHGIVPDAVIGDMDSLGSAGRFPASTRIIAIADQDSTDFEKALGMTQAPVTLAIGMTGGRFDHTLAALHAVSRHAAGRRIVLLDEHDLALGVAGDLTITPGAGQRVSVYPLGRTEFAGSSGLVYPLAGLVLEQGERVGTSNAASAETVSIQVAPGAQDPWLLIMDRGLLKVLIGLCPAP
ncbi:thiamine diphosphokinase [Pelagibacterium montanilacus]|uniref:thiamine diphosphokinase n=1 Tax=Pelagibacterium montanilacus TaxID=2185280 RepID=UPI0013E07C3D|nr:thiamine diphosphokinase [Pelagibacterium montanilacus]